MLLGRGPCVYNPPSHLGPNLYIAGIVGAASSRAPVYGAAFIPPPPPPPPTHLRTSRPLTGAEFTNYNCLEISLVVYVR